MAYQEIVRPLFDVLEEGKAEILFVANNKSKNKFE